MQALGKGEKGGKSWLGLRKAKSISGGEPIASSLPILSRGTAAASPAAPQRSPG